MIYLPSSQELAGQESIGGGREGRGREREEEERGKKDPSPSGQESPSSICGMV